MDQQYVDMYLRKKRGLTGPTSYQSNFSNDNNNNNGSSFDPVQTTSHDVQSHIHHNNPINSSGSVAPSHMVVRGAFNVQQFVDRIDTLAVQVETFEDKLINLTKLVKLSQALQDEKETDLRKQNHELKSRLKRQEQQTAKLTSEVEQLRSQFASLVREQITNATAPIIDDLRAYAAAADEGFENVEKRLQEVSTTLTEKLTTHHEVQMLTKVNHVQTSLQDELQQQNARHEAHLRGLEQRVQHLDTNRLQDLRQQLELRMDNAIQTSQSAAQSESKQDLDAVFARVQASLSNAAQRQDNAATRLDALERQTGSMDSAFTDFLATFKESTKIHAEKTDDIATTVREFVSLHEQTRNVVTSELESTKQWATRNLHRLKKHIDIINSDLLALRESHVDISSQLQRMRCTAEAEHDKLTALLQQKTREANMLTELVDKEIHSIHELTQQHRGVGGHSSVHSVSQIAQQPPAASSAPLELEPLGEAATIPGSSRNNNKGSSSLYDDLAFTRRPQN